MVDQKSDPIDQKASAVIKAAAANVDMNAGEFHYLCSHHPGGKCVGGFATSDKAKEASDKHKKDTGHTDCYAFGGKCPF